MTRYPERVTEVIFHQHSVRCDLSALWHFGFGTLSVQGAHDIFVCLFGNTRVFHPSHPLSIVCALYPLPVECIQSLVII